MFIRDRGHGVGSRIKSHLKYGGHWKEKKHGLYTSVAITNEHNTSQTCVYCFKKMEYPMKIVNEGGKDKVKSVNGALQCENSDCVAFKSKKTSRSRDELSSLAIGLASLSRLLFNATLPYCQSKEY
ncbi:hypothetical protein K501DRAFT_188097 [Backusella circina FSU 941]|nr:hypothetical protein K501DRAFT_188097 [Backusella circina FSU 941]